MEANAIPDFRPVVFGLQLLVEMQPEGSPGIEVHCPKGHPVQYGKVVSAGDGFDPDAGEFREMPPVAAIVAFEEHSEDVEGHYFFAGGREYRILHLDSVTVSFAPRQKNTPRGTGRSRKGRPKSE
jgi:hypothetical protein